HSFGDDRQFRSRLDPLQIFPRRRGVGSLASATGGPRWLTTGRWVVHAAGAAIVVADIALPLGGALRIQRYDHHFLARSLRAVEPFLSHLLVTEGIHLHP